MLRLIYSVRAQILIILVLLTILIIVVLGFFINSSQESVEDARIIAAAGEIRTFTTNIDLLTREITSTTIDNENVSLAFEAAVENDIHLLEAIQRFYGGSENVTREEFAAFLPFID